MSAPTTPTERVRHFLERREFVAPGSHVVWSDTLSSAVALRYDDVRALLTQLDRRAELADDLEDWLDSVTQTGFRDAVVCAIAALHGAPVGQVPA